jgi:hypothetical protein
MSVSFPTLMVSVIYCLWSAYRLSRLRRLRVLRERVAFMLWVMAQEIEEGGSIILSSPRRLMEEEKPPGSGPKS